MSSTYTLHNLNTCAAPTFCAAMDHIWENAPWVAARAVLQRPFSSWDALHQAMLGHVQALTETQRIVFYAGHPELGGEQARSGAMTVCSVNEQSSLGLEALDAQQAQRWAQYNRTYRMRFGFPFILCIRQHSMASALQTFEQRLGNDRTTEIRNALEQIAAISRLRLADCTQAEDHPVTATAVAAPFTSHP